MIMTIILWYLLIIITIIIFQYSLSVLKIYSARNVYIIYIFSTGSEYRNVLSTNIYGWQLKKTKNIIHTYYNKYHLLQHLLY